MTSVTHKITADDIFFPVTKPFNKGLLDVGNGHQIHYREIGNPEGPAVLLIHGGPGSSIPAGGRYTRMHDPKYFRIIAVDQRGCGQSIPHYADDVKAATHQNTPEKLAFDFEKIREHLGIEKWHVYGGSWGSCLSVYYASLYPNAVLSLTVYGGWMHTPDEIDWYINYMGLFFPEYEAKLLKLLPHKTKRFDRLDTLYREMTSSNKSHALKIAGAVGAFEGECLFFASAEERAAAKKKRQTVKQKKDEQRADIAVGGLEIFFMKKHPLPDGWYKSKTTVEALKKIKDFVIIQGRYDIVCPPTTAYDLHVAHKRSRLRIVHYAGHSGFEPMMLSVLKHENERLKYK